MSVERHTWIALIEQLGALLAVTITVPLPLGDSSAKRAQAGKLLQTACRALADARPSDAATATRRAAEILKELSPPANYRGVAARDRDLDQRFAALRNAVFDLTSGAVHADGIAATFTYTHADVAAVIACTAAIAARTQP